MIIDREFLYELENCKIRSQIEKIIENCDDDDVSMILKEKYEQILEFNQDEKIDNIKKIIIYRYRKYCSEN